MRPRVRPRSSSSWSTARPSRSEPRLPVVGSGERSGEGGGVRPGALPESVQLVAGRRIPGGEGWLVGDVGPRDGLAQVPVGLVRHVVLSDPAVEPAVEPRVDRRDVRLPVVVEAVDDPQALHVRHLHVTAGAPGLEKGDLAVRVAGAIRVGVAERARLVAHRPAVEGLDDPRLDDVGVGREAVRGVVGNALWIVEGSDADQLSSRPVVAHGWPHGPLEAAQHLLDHLAVLPGLGRNEAPLDRLLRAVARGVEDRGSAAARSSTLGPPTCSRMKRSSCARKSCARSHSAMNHSTVSLRSASSRDDHARSSSSGVGTPL